MTHPIVHHARGWIGTRFHHQGRVKKTLHHKGGVDCLGLLVGVAAELGLRGKDGRLLNDCDERCYSHQPDTVRLREVLEQILMPVLEAPAPGDVVLLSVAESPQHLAIVSALENGLGLIHAYAQARMVVEHPFDKYWRQSLVASYRIPLI